MQGGIVLAGAAAAAALGWGLFVVTYIIFRRWHRLAAQGWISVYYNRRAVIEGPITDYIQWCRMLDKEEARQGRILYTGGKIRVVLLRPGTRAR
jgi:hypothetical protein